MALPSRAPRADKTHVHNTHTQKTNWLDAAKPSLSIDDLTSSYHATFYIYTSMAYLILGAETLPPDMGSPPAAAAAATAEEDEESPVRPKPRGSSISSWSSSIAQISRYLLSSA